MFDWPNQGINYLTIIVSPTSSTYLTHKVLIDKTIAVQLIWTEVLITRCPKIEYSRDSGVKCFQSEQESDSYIGNPMWYTNGPKIFSSPDLLMTVPIYRLILKHFPYKRECGTKLGKLSQFWNPIQYLFLNSNSLNLALWVLQKPKNPTQFVFHTHHKAM